MLLQKINSIRPIAAHTLFMCLIYSSKPKGQSGGFFKISKSIGYPTKDNPHTTSKVIVFSSNFGNLILDHLFGLDPTFSVSDRELPKQVMHISSVEKRKYALLHSRNDMA